MYAVMSLLRRAAVSIIYVKAKHAIGGVSLKTPADILDISSAVWKSQEKAVPMFEIRVSDISSASAASKLSAQENKIFEAAGMEKKYYTLLMGPESEEKEGDLFVRTSRIGVLRGIFRSPKADAPLSKATMREGLQTKRARKIPKGAILETR